MLHKFKKVLLLVLVTLVFSVTSLRANTFMELESRYEGDGWFQYKLRLPVDPYWAFAEIGSLGIPIEGATGEGVIAPNWSSSSGGWLGVKFNTAYLQVRPAEYVFRVRSSYRHFKLKPYGCTMTFSLVPQAWMGLLGHGTVWSYNMVGFGNFDCLIPCSEGEADGSLPVFIKKWSIVPDVKIGQLLMNSNSLAGLTVAVPFDASFRVEGSSNLATWNTLLNSTGTAGTNSIYSPNFANGGPFYRVLITAFEGHQFFAPSPSEAAGIRGKLVEPVQLKNTPQGFVVAFPSKTSANYLIEFLSTKGEVLKTIRHVATAEETILPMPSDLGAEPSIVRVSTISTAAQ